MALGALAPSDLPPLARPANRANMRDAVLLVVLVLVTYAPTFFGGGAGFIWDDPDYIVQNANLHDLPGLIRTWTQPASLPQWYPLVHTVFWVEYQLWGLSAVGYHAVNVALHVLAVVLLWRLLRRLGFLPLAAFAAAGVWGLHPVQVESVAWITERKNTLSAVFYFAAFLSLLRFADARDRRQAMAPYSLALLLFALALFSKTVTASLPAAYLVVCWWKRGRLRLRADLLLMVPFLVLGGLLASHTAHLEVTHVGAHGPDWDWSMPERLLIAGRACWTYVACLLWPIRLAFIYERPLPATHDVLQWLYPLGIVVALSGLWLMRRRWGRAPFACAALFVGTLLPALGFANVFPHRYSFVADHFQYLASVALLVAAGVCLARLPRGWVIVVLLALALLSFRRTTVFRNELTLWEDTAAKTPSNPMVWANLARAHRESVGPTNSSAEHLQASQANFDALTHALALPSSPSIRAEIELTLGYAYEERGQPTRAEELYLAATRSAPGEPQGWFYLGRLQLRTGARDAGRISLEKAVALRPSYREASDLLHWMAASPPTTQAQPNQ